MHKFQYANKVSARCLDDNKVVVYHKTNQTYIIFESLNRYLTGKKLYQTFFSSIVFELKSFHGRLSHIFTYREFSHTEERSLSCSFTHFIVHTFVNQ